MNTLIWQTGLIGLAAGLGIVLLVRAVLPSQPNLQAALRRQFDPAADDIPLPDIDTSRTGLGTVIGIRVYPLLAHRSWMRIPYHDLAILRRSVPQYLGDKIGFLLVALLWPLVTNLVLTFVAPGSSVNWSLPIVASIALAVGAWFLPDISLREKADEARDNFARHLGAYIEMVTIVRANGSGTADSLHQAAIIGDSWVFLRLQEELDKADTSHRAPWDALRTLADEVDAPDLSDLADQLVLTSQGVSIADSMRETAKGLRNKNLSKEQSDATSATKRLRLPLGVLALLFVLIIIYPAGAAMVGT